MSSQNVTINAMKEFILQTVGSNVLCAWILYKDKIIVLKVGYTKQDYQTFLLQLDFTYNYAHGEQEIFGTIWLENGWYSRGNYDGSELWELNEGPCIPPECY